MPMQAEALRADGDLPWLAQMSQGPQTNRAVKSPLGAAPGNVSLSPDLLPAPTAPTSTLAPPPGCLLLVCLLMAPRKPCPSWPLLSFLAHSLLPAAASSQPRAPESNLSPELLFSIPAYAALWLLMPSAPNKCSTSHGTASTPWQLLLLLLHPGKNHQAPDTHPPDGSLPILRPSDPRATQGPL